MSPAARLAAFALAVGLALAGGAAAGAAIGPEPDRTEPSVQHGDAHP